MSDCSDLLGALSDYLDGDERSAMCRELVRHMEGCDKCRLVVDSAKKTIQLYRGEELLECPPEVKARLHGTLRSAWARRSGGRASTAM
jgi:predicted anti-sigma-YlaC factor YlaD